MKQYPFDRDLAGESDVLDYFAAAIQYRNAHKNESADIAMHVFDRTHPRGRLTFPIGAEIDRLRDEFGALEAPGMPDNDTQSFEDHEDEVWLRLLNLIEDAKKSRTV